MRCYRDLSSESHDDRSHMWRVGVVWEISSERHVNPIWGGGGEVFCSHGFSPFSKMCGTWYPDSIHSVPCYQEISSIRRNLRYRAPLNIVPLVKAIGTMLVDKFRMSWPSVPWVSRFYYQFFFQSVLKRTEIGRAHV